MKKIVAVLAIVLAAAFFAVPPSAHADWINLTGAENARNIAEIYIETDRVLVRFEIFVGDLMAFEKLIPDDLIGQPVPGRPSEDERIRFFADNTFQIIADGEDHLPARLVLVEPRMRIERPSPFAGSINPYTRRPVPGPPDDKRVLYAEVEYPFGKRPETLTFIPPLDETGLPRVSLGFICYHAGVPVVDFRHLGDRNLLYLDWEDPWYSRFEKKQLKRWQLSGLRTYIYVEPYEVRHEILIRVKDLQHWMPLGLRGGEFIETDEFDPLRQRAAQFFLEREKVLIDGEERKPILDRVAYVESGMLRSRFIQRPERLPLNTAMLGIVITYLTEGIPGEVTAQWDMFSERIPKVPSVMTDPAGPFPYDLEPGDNVLRWTNYLKNYTIPTVTKVDLADRHTGFPLPVGTVVCLGVVIPIGVQIRSRRKKGLPMRQQGIAILVLLVFGVALAPVSRITVGAAQASQVTPEDATTILDGLLKNVYRAFDFREESDVYDKLAVSVNGDLLADIYLQHRKSMIVEQAGGAQAKVETVRIENVDVADSAKRKNALDFHATWTAAGRVGHWGHTHTRQNLYEAIVTVEPVDGAWQIVALEVLEEKRVDPYAKKAG